MRIENQAACASCVKARARFLAMARRISGTLSSNPGVLSRSSRQCSNVNVSLDDITSLSHSSSGNASINNVTQKLKYFKNNITNMFCKISFKVTYYFGVIFDARRDINNSAASLNSPERYILWNSQYFPVIIDIYLTIIQTKK